jgi:hypothetical protein
MVVAFIQTRDLTPTGFNLQNASATGLRRHRLPGRLDLDAEPRLHAADSSAVGPYSPSGWGGTGVPLVDIRVQRAATAVIVRWVVPTINGADIAEPDSELIINFLREHCDDTERPAVRCGAYAEPADQPRRHHRGESRATITTRGARVECIGC